MPGTTALIVNHENITFNYYRGRDRAFLLPGALFRPGGAAVVLSNRCCARLSPPPCLQEGHMRRCIVVSLMAELSSATCWQPHSQAPRLHIAPTQGLEVDDAPGHR